MSGVISGPVPFRRVAELDEAGAAQLYVQTARRTADDRIEISVAAAARIPVPAPDCR